MDNLAFLALLACPLMMGGLLYLIMRGTQNKDHGAGNTLQTEKLQENMSKLMKQNEQMLEEIERMKRSR
ncbi:hypothetical protein AWH56_004290 [Anaerobacillus isosaccharinicus]|uniref:DUF2933 domain-containing protein n=1 Tax=Anaerobacillus isosaccharinicus TaxID=1532552 RepID=A0A1S2L314_9BACI|nr:hypothetical protein [Anaerobacillus isosaccharinicus]MBA5584754.1 hypothetical protein [Anaerobacillus isosaccharinicus]QOY36878.1 hypothetical protein AWH56_004290 [Anaerobacillus isosaccharinicus]